MNITEHLCVVAMEECAEIQQAISKFLRFGDGNHCDEDNKVHENAKQIWIEYYQLQAVMEMLRNTGEIGHLDNKLICRIIDEKKNKVSAYINVSKDIGTVIG